MTSMCADWITWGLGDQDFNYKFDNSSCKAKNSGKSPPCVTDNDDNPLGHALSFYWFEHIAKTQR